MFLFFIQIFTRQNVIAALKLLDGGRKFCVRKKKGEIKK